MPTKPKLRVYAVVGMPGTKSTAMRRFSNSRKSNLLGENIEFHRFDHAPFFSMQQAEYTIPFYVKEDKSVGATAERQSWLTNPNRKRGGWWEPLTTEDGLPPPEVSFPPLKASNSKTVR